VKKDQDESITSNSLRSLNSSCEEVKDSESQRKKKKLQLKGGSMMEENYFTPQKKKGVCNSHRNKIQSEFQYKHTKEGVFFQTLYDKNNQRQNQFFISYNFNG